MWNQLSYPWQAAAELAWEAACSGTIPIGAVIVDGQGRVVSAGRNRIHEPRNGSPGDSCPLYLSGAPLAHAEVNALLALDYQAVNPYECTLYTTTEPCPMCAGAIVMANVRHVCYASRDPWAGSTGLFTGDTYMGSKHVRVEGPPDALFEVALVALQVDYFLREWRRTGKALFKMGSPFFNCLEAVIPLGVTLGERLFNEGTLERMRAKRLPVGQVLDELVLELAVQQDGKAH